jgi:hypothetical protein
VPRRFPAGFVFLVPLCLALARPATSQALHELVGGCGGAPPERNLPANPANYLAVLAGAGPGDPLQLAAGTYPQGLPFTNRNGQPNRCIVVEGPVDGPPARFTGSDGFNTVSFRNSSYIAVRNLDLDGLGLAGDGVKAEGDAQWSHHITVENLHLVGYGAEQGRVGISTKHPAWNWVIRRNVIVGAGTGLYLGNSDGSAEFVGGLIEHNALLDAIGYDAQVKHQTGRAVGLGVPAAADTIIRHNVFSKAQGFSTGDDARPNLLVGHWPLAGAGSTDRYLIYGNLFYQNPSEALFQGEGNLALYSNLFVNRDGPAIHVQPHNDEPRAVEVFWNTVVASTTGISVTGGATGYVQNVRFNAVFAAPAISGGVQSGNVSDASGMAGDYLADPDGTIGADPGLDLFPEPGALAGSPPDTSGLTALLDWDRDFDSLARSGTLRGAYGLDVGGPAWRLALDRKPVPAAPAADFYTLPPCRLLDTRGPAGIAGGPALVAGAVRPFPVAGRCGVPLGAVSVAVNATVVGPGAAGFVALYPAGRPRPSTSTLNFRAGQTRANNAVVALSDQGEVAAYEGSTGDAHFVLDVVGYFR